MDKIDVSGLNRAARRAATRRSATSNPVEQVLHHDEDADSRTLSERREQLADAVGAARDVLHPREQRTSHADR